MYSFITIKWRKKESDYLNSEPNFLYFLFEQISKSISATKHFTKLGVPMLLKTEEGQRKIEVRSSINTQKNNQIHSLRSQFKKKVTPVPQHCNRSVSTSTKIYIRSLKLH